MRGVRWVWHYRLPKEPLALVPALRAHGIGGLVPQESAAAIAWARRWAGPLADEGIATVIGLGKVSAKNILDALDVPHTSGVMVNQEDWKSVSDSLAVVDAVLAARADAPDRVMDCHYPCLTKNPETGKNTGWGKIARAWSRLCGLRAPQCYWARGGGGTTEGPRDGWVGARLAYARSATEYPAHGSPASRVRCARQLYRASVTDHVRLAVEELATGSLWLWNWPEADGSARTALRVVVALEGLGHTGPDAIEAFQSEARLSVDGVVGPMTCAALGVRPDVGCVWSRRG